MADPRDVMQAVVDRYATRGLYSSTFGLELRHSTESEMRFLLTLAGRDPDLWAESIVLVRDSVIYGTKETADELLRRLKLARDVELQANLNREGT